MVNPVSGEMALAINELPGRILRRSLAGVRAITLIVAQPLQLAIVYLEYSVAKRPGRPSHQHGLEGFEATLGRGLRRRRRAVPADMAVSPLSPGVASTWGVPASRVRSMDRRRPINNKKVCCLFSSS